MAKRQYNVYCHEYCLPHFLSGLGSLLVDFLTGLIQKVDES